MHLVFFVGMCRHEDSRYVALKEGPYSGKTDKHIRIAATCSVFHVDTIKNIAPDLQNRHTLVVIAPAQTIYHQDLQYRTGTHLNIVMPCYPK